MDIVNTSILWMKYLKIINIMKNDEELKNSRLERKNFLISKNTESLPLVPVFLPSVRDYTWRHHQFRGRRALPAGQSCAHKIAPLPKANGAPSTIQPA